MNPVTPKVKAPIVIIAENQPEFEPLKIALVAHPDFEKKRMRIARRLSNQTSIVEMNTVLMAFKPTPDELVALNDGKDVYIALLTHGKPQPAIIVSVGTETVNRDYSLEPA